MARLNEDIAQLDHLVGVLLMLSDDESPSNDPHLLDLMREASSKLVSYNYDMYAQLPASNLNTVRPKRLTDWRSLLLGALKLRTVLLSRH